MTLSDLSTKIRGFAYECGGGHHTLEEIQKALLEMADAIDETVFNITNVSKVGAQTIQEITGMDDRYYDLCRKHKWETGLKGEDNWFNEMEEAENRYEHKKRVESLEKGENNE